jgi:hypothetical protein
MKVWLERTMSGCRPADDASAGILKKIPLGTTFEAAVITRKLRSGAWHRRYWGLMSLLASHVERVEIEPGAWFEISNDPEKAHAAMKYCTGLYDTYVIEGGGFVRMLKSTAFDRMAHEDWVTYWNKVLDAVHQKFLKHVDLTDLHDEILRCCGEAA